MEKLVVTHPLTHSHLVIFYFSVVVARYP